MAWVERARSSDSRSPLPNVWTEFRGHNTGQNFGDTILKNFGDTILKNFGDTILNSRRLEFPRISGQNFGDTILNSRARISGQNFGDTILRISGTQYY